MQDGGVVGGNPYDVSGKTYYMGGSYNVRFTEAIVMNGRLSYMEPWANSGSGGDYVCVDLRTGEELWRINVTSTGKPVFGYLYSLDTGNQHGVIPNGWLFTFDFARAYDPLTGVVSTLNITNVPSGTAVAGPQGEILRYVWNTNGKWLAQWNSSKVFADQSSGTINASTAARYDWNVTLSSLANGTWSIIRHIIPGNVLLLSKGSFGGPRATGTGVDIAAISLKPNSIGQVLWNKYYPVAPNNVTRKLIAVDEEAGTFVFQDKETLQLTGCSLANGEQLWTLVPDDAKWDTMRSVSLAAYGNLYVSGFDGVLHCYDMKDGNLLWTYGNGGPGNSTYAGLETTWGHYPIFVDVIADGKVYLGTTEHSPGSPFYKEAQYRCLNASTGEELWTMMGWGTGMYVGQSDLVADGFFVYFNCYDSKIYSVGKGPSAMTVEAPMTAAKLGESMVIRGTVTDIAAGTEQKEQAARFPNGVPAMSDASMGEWMEYVYMQKPKPTNATGVPVEVEVVDSNNNRRTIGTATSDSSGMFTFSWKPDIEGDYKVIATFAGSESYWPSSAETSFVVDPAPEAPAEVTIPPDNSATYATYSTIYIIAGIAIVGAILALLMLRKR
jgi:outer membrane protein assembly factor BamB